MQQGGEAKSSHGPLPAMAKLTTGLDKREGLLTFYADRQRGKIWLEVPPAKILRQIVADPPDRVRLLEQGRNQGKGSAIRRGIAEATGASQRSEPPPRR